MNKKMQIDISGIEAECMSTQAICELLPCAVPAATILSWGFTPHAKIKAGLWWRCDEVPAILLYLERKIAAAREAL
jgi:hypothetical protein